MAAFPHSRSRWAGAAVLLAGAAVPLTAWAGTRPSYDAYGWLTWGHMTLHGGLDTNAAPSWKPLPYVFTVVYGLFGSSAAMWLWMGTATAVALAGVAVAGRLAYRLSASEEAVAATGPRWAAWIAAVLAAAALLALHDEFPYGYLHYVLSAQSDPMIVACVLGALDCVLCGRGRCAFGLLWLAALGRPEAWPLLVLDGAWLWRRSAGFRWVIGGAVLAAGLLWFGIPALSSRSWWVAAENADASGFGPTGNRALGVLGRFIAQTPWPLQLGALGMAGVGLWRRERTVLLLLGGILVWMAVEVGFGLHGWPALGRYMFEPSAALVVLGAGFVGRSLGGLSAAWQARGVASPSPGGAASRTDVSEEAAARGWATARGWTPAGLAGTPTLAGTAALLGAAVLAGTVPALVHQGRAARDDLVAQRTRTTSIVALGRSVAALGGPARLRGCGEVISDGLGSQTVLAYDVGENVNRVGYRFPQPGHPRDPIIVFSPDPAGGWRVRALRQSAPGCRSLPRRAVVLGR